MSRIVEQTQLSDPYWHDSGAIQFGIRAGRHTEKALLTVANRGRLPGYGSVRVPASWRHIARAELARREALEA